MSNPPHIPTVAIVYDKVSVGFGGAERVLQALHAAYPKAPLFTSLATTDAKKWSRSLQIKSSFLQKLSWIPQSYRLLVPLFPLAFESFSLDEFDIVISVTSGEAKGVLTKPNQLHVCYLLTPPRYLYSHAEAYGKHSWVSSSLVQPLYRLATSYLRWWDMAAAQRPDYLVPISNLVSNRARTFYQRVCEPVLYPPAPFFSTAKPFDLQTKYLLSVSRFVPYKRVDLSILACKKLERVLVVVGDGMEASRLHLLAAGSGAVRQAEEPVPDFINRSIKSKKLILFVGTVLDSDLQRLYSGAEALLMPGIEDFGITALEAAQQGTLTILPIQSGVAELLTPPKHAIQLFDLTVDAMIESIKKLENTDVTSESLRNIAKVHTFSYFQKSVGKRIAALWQRHNDAKEIYVTT